MPTDRDKQVSSPQVKSQEPSSAANAQTPSGSNGTAKAAPYTPPAIALPKGGGAIRGIGEKFTANPATGTGSFSVPLPVSSSRSNFGPQLNLNYDSGSGNGPFGIGWSLSLPSITRKTDKGLPQYLDNDESDVFILSGAEDLVPVLKETAGGWVRETLPPRTINGEEFRIQRYRPRVEGIFARVERWTSLQTGESHWRSITRDNVTTLYGTDDNSRIFSFAEADPQHTRQIFSWLISESYDDKGNAIVYQYARETADNVDVSLVNERNRERTANRYVKRILYGNRTSRLVQPDLSLNQWLFELVFDYDEDHYEVLPLDPNIPANAQHQFVRAAAASGVPWAVRPDPFSACRSGFEVRTYRRCRRVLMFHHFDELGPEQYLARSIEFDYADLDYTQPTTIDDELNHQGSTRFASFIQAIEQSGYVRDDTRPVVRRNGINYFTYLKKSLPRVELTYSKAIIADDVRELDASSSENMPAGIDDTYYRFVDLDGEGISGVLTEQASNWFYKPNLGDGKFGEIQVLQTRPSLANLTSGQQQLLDLAGDGQLDLVQFRPQTPGFYERTEDESWESFKPFTSQLNISWDEPNLRFVDLNGDGHADVLITEHEAITWYPSLGEEGFSPARRVRHSLDEEKGPRLVLADGTQSIYLADMCGDGLTDLVRVRNGEVCYWPNLGYGRFGAKVTMDNSPQFDRPDQFSQQRVRLADVDGSGVIDIIYLDEKRGARLYFNQSGNRWSEPRLVPQFPQLDSVSSVTTADLLGNGTACLVWSTSLPAQSRRPLRYLDLMSGQKPHLLTKISNNLGAETTIEYAPSTKFYLADKAAGTPWVTKIPFVVQVVERIITEDRVSRNRFVTRQSYHHGFFDGVEREFRGFGRVDQFDTEEFAALNINQDLPPPTNIEASSHVPPVLTRTWFHTGVYLGGDRVSRFFAGLEDGIDVGEYYREPGLTDAQASRLLLDDTVLPLGLTVDEEREACRALRGSMLRQEVYALDGTAQAIHPYTVSEQNFTIEVLQPQGENRHAVFFTHPREALNYQYERDPDDPRVSHSLTLEVDDFGNVLKTAAINYGRRVPDPSLDPRDRAKQQLLITYTENDLTNAITSANDDYRTPLPSESRVYEFTGLTLTAGRIRFTLDDILIAAAGAIEIAYETAPSGGVLQKRLIEHLRTIYRRNDLSGPAPLGQVESLALPFEVYKQAFTPGLITAVYGTRVTNTMLADEARYVHSEGDANWWIPSGKIFYSINPADTSAQELAHAQANFFLPHRYRTQFHTTLVPAETVIVYDAYHLLLLESRDALDNRITVGERDAAGNITLEGNDYRVLQPARVMDSNRNRSLVKFDALGQVVGTAVMGKPAPAPVEGDSLTGFTSELTEAELLAQLANPLATPAAVLINATSRVIYDLFAYQRTKTQPAPQGPVTYTLARESHVAAPLPPGGLKFQHNFCYSDGFAREIQKKTRAEAGPVPQRDAQGRIIVGPDGQPVITAADVSPRWVGSGWTVFNNKGKAVRQFEPFFTDTHHFELDVRIGVSPIIFYDPVGRMVGALHPNHTWEKIVFDPWRQETSDVNDTVLIADPRTDADLGNFFARLPTADFLPTWHTQRQGGALGPDEQAAAVKAAIHANTPTLAHADSLGRNFLTVLHNKFKYSNSPPLDPPVEEFHLSRVDLDIESNERNLFDTLDRLAMRYDYDMLGNRIHQASMEAGERWMLNDVVGKPLYAFDSRDHRLRTSYDPLRRPTDSFMKAGAAAEITVGRIVYGESQPNPEALNLRNTVFQTFDQAGVVTTDLYDFKGNRLRVQRRLAVEYSADLNWAGAVPLEAETFTTSTTFDALDRPTEIHHPDNSTIRARFNEATLLERLEVNLRGVQKDGEPVWTVFVSDVDYNSRGQRVSIDYGNDTRTIYEYDPLTFRMTRLRTQRDSVAFPGDCPQPPLPGWPGCKVQNLQYTYDPIGNITHIRDDAQQTVYFRNRRVEPTADYTYDSIYRLIDATGREHLGAVGGAPIPHSYNDVPRIGILLSTSDGNAMGRYFERYAYDPAGNILEMLHRGSDPVNPGWTRSYAYNEISQLQALRRSNRLTSTTVGATTETYSTAGNGYDPHGNMLRLPQLQAIDWDFKDQMRMSRRQAVNPSDADGLAHQGERTWYVYDSGGQRVRKVTELADGRVRDERVYLGGFELYRRGGANPLRRETLHVMDDKERVALVETRTLGTEPGVPEQMIRFQYDNHLGSACLELDDQAQVISYEEYTPYGSTSFQAVRSQTETPKRYRYAGKERDEESGLNYHNARYFVPWLARWLNTDPIGVSDGLNLYAYCKNNPVVHTDNSGTDARLSVDQTTSTITYSTTVHFYGNAQEIADFRGAARRATEFYTNQSGSVNIDGRVWNVQFDVQFQFHDTGVTPLPSGFDTILNQLQDPKFLQTLSDYGGLLSLYSDAHLRSFHSATAQVTGFRAGDSVITLRDLPTPDGGQTPAATTFRLLPSSLPVFRAFQDPTTKALIALDRGQATTEDATYRTLIHEIGHTLGFDERYGPDAAGDLVSNNQFNDDFMGNDTSVTVGMSAEHRAAAARFADYVSNGNNVHGAVLRDFKLDSTLKGTVEQFYASGRRNPDYEDLQSRLRTDVWSRFRQQISPPPPPPVQFFGINRDPLGRTSPFQVLPGWNPQTPQTVPILGGRF